MSDSSVQNDELDVTVIIVSYNTRDMTLACLRSVVEQQLSPRYEIIVLDNASADGSAEAISAEFPRIELIRSQDNLGFGRGNNVAATRARGRRILLLNPDTVILDHAIDRLLAFAQANPDCRIWGGRTVFADGTLNPASCWKEANLWSIFCYSAGLTKFKGSRFFNPEGYGDWKRDAVRPVDIVSGCFLMIDRDLWRQLDGFDPQFFMYGEEADLCLRARKFGARPMITPDATIIHHGRASEPDRAEQRIKVLAGRITLMEHHQPALKSAIGRLLYLLLPITRILAFGSAALLLGHEGYRRKEQDFRRVWEDRKRWINGWDSGAIARAQQA